MKAIYLFFAVALIFTTNLLTAQDYESDKFQSEGGELTITFIKHGTLMFEYNEMVIHVDPVSRMGNYNKLPQADIILITHHHGDHFDLNAIHKVKKDETKIIATQKCKDMSEELESAIIMSDHESKNIAGLKINSVPAYNIKHKRKNGEPYHKKGDCNGYVITLGNKKIYVAGDTEDIPEMKNLTNIDIAFLPMNVPYTMTPEMAAEAAKAFKPSILYPYHYGNTDTSKLVELLKDTDEIEVRIRKM